MSPYAAKWQKLDISTMAAALYPSDEDLVAASEDQYDNFPRSDKVYILEKKNVMGFLASTNVSRITKFVGKIQDVMWEKRQPPETGLHLIADVSTGKTF